MRLKTLSAKNFAPIPKKKAMVRLIISKAGSITITKALADLMAFDSKKPALLILSDEQYPADIYIRPSFGADPDAFPLSRLKSGKMTISPAVGSGIVSYLRRTLAIEGTWSFPVVPCNEIAQKTWTVCVKQGKEILKGGAR